MGFNDDPTQSNLKRKVDLYNEILKNTQKYREVWQSQLANELLATLKRLTEAVGLQCTIERKTDMGNLETVLLTLGNSLSGLQEALAGGIKRDLLKHHGTLIYQQLFNGKILVMIQYPAIEKLGQPQEPKTVAIYRPEELKEAFITRHLETFIDEVTRWEDYDDEVPNEHPKIGFKFDFEKEGQQPAS